MIPFINPFHSGEIAAQRMAGVSDLAPRVAHAFRDALPEQHRAFHTSLPFVILAAADGSGRPWVTLLEGEPGFIASPDPTRLAFAGMLAQQDPLFESFAAGADVGLLGIELATRRRNRLSGEMRQDGSGYILDVRQTFGNCPRYIHPRTWQRISDTAPGAVQRSSGLNVAQMAQIRAADTLFIGSGQREAGDLVSNGFDASHRGGSAGFVEIVDGTHLRIPDYAGNNFFNTIGNILKDPRIGVLFVDFETGGLLQMTGRAEVDWAPGASAPVEARRVINVTVEEVIDRPNASSLRWTPSEVQPRGRARG